MRPWNAMDRFLHREGTVTLGDWGRLQSLREMVRTCRSRLDELYDAPVKDYPAIEREACALRFTERELVPLPEKC